MKRINKLSEIPSWFDHLNYEGLEYFTNNQWYQELDFRQTIQIFLNAMKLDPNADNFDWIKSVVESYIYQISRAPTKQKREKLFGVYDLYESSKEKCLNKSELLAVDEFQRKNQINQKVQKILESNHYHSVSLVESPIAELSLFSAGLLVDFGKKIYRKEYKRVLEKIKPSFEPLELENAESSLDMFFSEVSLGDYFWSADKNSDNAYPELEILKELNCYEKHDYFAVDLSVDEDVLVKEFKRKIKMLKKRRKLNHKSIKASENKLKNIYLHRVLQYLDLKNWAEYHGVTIENNLMNQVLFPNNEYHVGITKETAKKVLTPHFIESINILF